MLSDYKSCKLIEKGGIGSIYLARKNDITEVVVKVETHDSKYRYYRQLDFDKNICKNNTDMFTHIVSNKLICSSCYKNILENVNHDCKSIIDNKTYISIVEMLPVLDGTLNSIRNKLSTDEKINCIKTLLKAIQIMRKEGYEHRDLHGNNIMYKAIKDDDGKSINYNWYIIDYNCVYNQKYEQIIEDSEINNRSYSNDVIAVLMLFLPNNASKFLKRQNKKLPTFTQLYKKIKQSYIYTKISALIDDSFVKNSVKDLDIHIYHTFIVETFYYDEYLRLVGINKRINRGEEKIIKILGYVIKNISRPDVYDTVIKLYDA